MAVVRIHSPRPLRRGAARRSFLHMGGTVKPSSSPLGDFVVADTIEQSFNRVATSDLPASQKELLQQLAQAVSAMCRELPPQAAKVVAGEYSPQRSQAERRDNFGFELAPRVWVKPRRRSAL